ncbi:hypothetical protein BCONGLO52_07400 [Brachybacterium conglomeratum]|uniref:Uncharacterized protein n=1 Tax=Brachybacterium conglomeratum TaxID=47846 RepID=A0ABQ5RDD0_9MICO|nr:hypothetical protein BCONGLO52_07400 [Brachybacterium conglomeratum]GLK05924.1 hypothetical protein GCM10017597_27240 [Brachybacterium conglomeratum]
MLWMLMRVLLGWGGRREPAMRRGMVDYGRVAFLYAYIGIEERHTPAPDRTRRRRYGSGRRDSCGGRPARRGGALEQQQGEVEHEGEHDDQQ